MAVEGNFAGSLFVEEFRYTRVCRQDGAVTIARYRCERCGAVWEYENNKVNRHAG